MKIIDLLHQRPTLSFEIFPPKNHDGDISSIYSTIDELAKLKPDFISVTLLASTKFLKIHTKLIFLSALNKHFVL